MAKRLSAAIIDLLVYGWIPFVAILAFSAVMAQGSTVDEAPGIHLSIGVIAVVVGIVAFIGPGFYLLGRYDHRLSTAEAALAAVAVKMEHLVERGISTGDRVAVAIEQATEYGLVLNCPLENECPHPKRKV